MNKKIILITTLAEYQTFFWIKIVKELRKKNFNVAFISFDDRSTEALLKNKFQTYFLEKKDLANDVSDGALSELMLNFGISDFTFWASHERITFGLNEQKLRKKFIEYLTLANRACFDLKKNNNKVVLIQELGGFLSIVASFFAAKKFNITNWFIEPSFFKGRLFFLKNSFSAAKIPLTLKVFPSNDLIKYLQEVKINKHIVIPKKDAHQYTSPFKKILNSKNMIRLIQKIYDKYFLGKKQEFSFIGRYVITHLRMTLNSLILRREYSNLSEINNIIYYPLHVPCDVALTLRSPQYLDQLSLVDFILRNIPHTHKLIIKEHPAMIGAIDARRLVTLKNKYENLSILHPSTNNYDVLLASKLVISVNSKAGAEALLLNKPLIVLGDAFYSNSPFARSLKDISGLKEEVNNLLKYPKINSEACKTENYFELVWRTSYVGELYSNDLKNIQMFTKSIISAIG